MVSVKTLLAAGAALLVTTASAATTAAKILSTRNSPTPCGIQPVPGIKKPIDGTTITYTTAEQYNSDGVTIEIIYCSGDYFKTSSLNVTAVLSTTSSQGMVIGSAEPNYNAAPPGYYGYIFDVTVYPAEGFLSGVQQLSIFEVETGYYNDYNFKLFTVTIDFKIDS